MIYKESRENFASDVFVSVKKRLSIFGNYQVILYDNKISVKSRCAFLTTPVVLSLADFVEALQEVFFNADLSLIVNDGRVEIWADLKKAKAYEPEPEEAPTGATTEKEADAENVTE